MADTTTTNFALVKVEVGASENTWGAKLNTNTDKADALGLGVYTYGGTADAITVTTGMALAAIPVGMQIRFLATAANTGATTINVDGIGAVAALTVGRRVALPASYIRTDAMTSAEWNGTNWIVDREPQFGTPFLGVRGDFIRYADGTLICRFEQGGTNDMTTATGALFRRATPRTWTFPATFMDFPAVAATFPRESGLILEQGLSSTEYSYYPAAVTSISGATAPIRLAATGRWY